MAPLSQKFEQSADQADASGYRALIGMPDAALQQEFVALLVASLREATGEVNSARAQVTISSWYRLAKQDRVSAYVLKADGRLVSAAALIRKEPRTLHYVTVGTAPEERNSGVNSLLRRKVHQWAATHDVDVLSGVVASTNTPIMNIVRALNSTLLPYALHFELNLSSNAST
ncbi:acetyltransferase (GNAT) family protein [Deinococcus yavapaiensis KR-236]|uniref:Acetyltransferase (GNAT) family protein n=2 Tax=Deinococcus TaxID=1298 RepID=A0A318S1A9_9DEIO|nr:acetyltransferase (GNAT) family protein [Deinococcus yavapaiensis KR-236]